MLFIYKFCPAHTYIVADEMDSQLSSFIMYWSLILE